jgi:hypothetical protein
MDEADEDILLDAQRPCYVKEEKLTASAALTIGDVTKPMTGKEKKKMEPLHSDEILGRRVQRDPDIARV